MAGCISTVGQTNFTVANFHAQSSGKRKKTNCFPGDNLLANSQSGLCSKTIRSKIP